MKDIYNIYEGLLAGQNSTLSSGTNLVSAAKKEFDSIVKLMKNKNSWEKFGYNNRRFWRFVIKDNMIQNISELFGLSNTYNNKDQFWITISRHNISIDKWEVDILYIDQNGAGWCDLTGCNKKVKDNIETKMAADTHKKTLIDFYRDLPDGQEGTDLGLYYLSYLDDACKKVNVKFESLVNQFSASDLTVINLIFNF